MATRSTKMATTKTTPSTAKTTTKTTTAKAVATAPKATVVETVIPVVADIPVKKPEFIDRVVTETGMKKKDVKPVVEAALAVLGRALANGEELTMPPLGKLMIKRVKDLPNAKILTLKLRYKENPGQGGSGPAKDPLADAAE